MSRSFFCHMYLALWCLYWMQGTLFASGGYISQGVLAFLLLVSFYFFITAHFRYNLPRVMKTMSVMVVLLMVYGLVAIISGRTYHISEIGIETNAFGYLKNVLISFLPVYTIFFATKRGYLTDNSLRLWSIIFLLVAIAEFYRVQADSVAFALQGADRGEIVNNSAYTVLALMVLIPLFKNRPFIQYVFLAVCMYFVLIGMKRGALICGTMSTLWFLFNSILIGKKTKKRVWIFLLTAVIVLGALFAVSYMLETSDYFNRRIESTLAGESTTRAAIYSTLIQHFVSETSIIRFLFGNGANATLSISTNYAHNDWLEMAIDNGVAMLIIYIVYWFRMFKTVRNARGNYITYMMISMFFIIYLAKSFFSMSYADIPTWASTGLGFSLAKYSSHENNAT